MRSLSGLVLIALLSGCSSAPDPGVKKEASPAPVAPKTVVDHSSVLPREGQVSTSLVQDHMIDIAKLPGGALGVYSRRGQKFQLFIIEAGTNQKAAFMLLDAKATIQDAEYFPNTGGYFGSDGKRLLYILAKKHYLAGVVGLKRSDADRVAIELVSHLN